MSFTFLYIFLCVRLCFIVILYNFLLFLHQGDRHTRSAGPPLRSNEHHWAPGHHCTCSHSCSCHFLPWHLRDLRCLYGSTAQDLREHKTALLQQGKRTICKGKMSWGRKEWEDRNQIPLRAQRGFDSLSLINPSVMPILSLQSGSRYFLMQIYVLIINK